MIIIPAIDLKDGRCVRLAQGDFSRVTVYSDDPVGIAKKWQENGAERIHVIDLDGSWRGSPRNMDVIRDIVAEVGLPIEVGGGIRDMNTIGTYIGMGVKWVILGTMALKDKGFVTKACQKFKGEIILGMDASEGKVSIQGWTEQTSESAADIAKGYEGYGLAAIIYTDIKRDGMETGVNIEATRELAQSVDIPIIASGGVSGTEDIRRLREVEKFGVIGVIIGRALYSGAVSLKEAISLSKL
ncbi:MAG TPA: 1-(5-phosphoribosyl)-5-[(5-phosphoribosylamino)methylideneamino]imidazole-4-carboxamide isomerase [Syntrophales bacterium]|nr:1-(5-phosphoribosyl)-5-[(5-phosphoribosylamino)methylideneamino]imidazole-4-carboxamide isomerase [Syntrophales bacterium]